MRDVPVAAQHVLAAVVRHRLQPRFKEGQKSILRGLPLGPGRTRRQVQRGHGERPQVEGQITSFIVEFGRAQRVVHGIGRVAAVHRNPGVALLLRAAKGHMPALGAKVFIQVARLRLGLLHADHVGTGIRQPFKKPLARGRANTVGVDADDAHVRLTRKMKRQD